MDKSLIKYSFEKEDLSTDILISEEQSNSIGTQNTAIPTPTTSTSNVDSNFIKVLKSPLTWLLTLIVVLGIVLFNRPQKTKKTTYKKLR